jgi:WD40 repeat protein
MCVVTASFSPVGNIFLTGSLNGSVVEWDAISGARRRVVLEPEPEAPSLPPRLSECMWGSPIRCVRFSPDGSLFAAGAANGAIVLWNAENRAAIQFWPEHQAKVDALAISPDSRWLAVGSVEDAIDSLRVWRRKQDASFEFTEAFSSDRHIGGVSSLCFSPDSRTLAAGGFSMSGYTGPLLYDLATGKGVGGFYYDMTRSLDISPDGRLLVTGDDFGTVRFWDVESKTRLFEAKGHERMILVVRFSPDGARLATGSVDCSVRVWDMATRETLARYDCHGVVLAIHFDEDFALRVVATAERSSGPRLLHFP